MEEMAKQVKDAKLRRRIREKLKILLLQSPNDDKNISLKSVEPLVEQKQPFSPGDLLTMYQKYAEAQGWRFESWKPL